MWFELLLGMYQATFYLVILSVLKMHIEVVSLHKVYERIYFFTFIVKYYKKIIRSVRVYCVRSGLYNYVSA